MASSRDDFIIAIRSAFLKKSTQQKFSLLTLVFFSLFIIILSTFDFKVIRFSKETGLPVHIAEDPLSCVAVGTGKALDQEQTFSTMMTEY